MSQRTRDVIAVYSYVKPRFIPACSASEFQSLRRDAVRHVATRRGVAVDTVRDACVRRLEPFVFGVEAFDVLLREALCGRPAKLREALMTTTVDEQDGPLVSRSL